MTGERIAKVMAAAGVCSRREAEKLIAEGLVIVNGQKLDTPAFKVTQDDVITVRGKPISAKQANTRVWLYHKPAGLVTSHKDEKNRPTVFGALPKEMPRVVSVGRLDLNSEGLLLLTTNGGLAGKIAHPSTGWRRTYRARVFGEPTEKQLDKLRRGITIEGIRYAPCEITMEKAAKNSWLRVTLTEGKNREIRKLFEAIDYPVSRLIRTSFGPFQLGKLERGQIREVEQKTIKAQLGALMK